jgi:cobalt-zinc-cadmium efflux system outer membrane protein
VQRLRCALIVFSMSITTPLSAPGYARAQGARPDRPPTSSGERAAGTPLPALEHVLELARDHAPEVELGSAALAASRTSATGARRAPLGNPVITSFAEHGKGTTRDVYVESQLDLPLEIWGQRRKRIAEANAHVAHAEVGLDVARATALGWTVEAYGSVAVALERLRVIDDAIAAAHKEAELYRARVELQDATLRDAHHATMEVARNEILRQEAEADLQAGLGLLRRLTGREFVADAPPAEGAAPPMPATLERASAAAQSAPVVRESLAEAAYHERVGERARAEARMPLGLVARAARGDMAEPRFGGGVSLGLPLFQRNQAERAQAKAAAERARRTSSVQQRALEATLLGLSRELEQLSAARRILEETALPAAAAAVRAAEEIQASGKGELMPVLISRRDYAALRLRRLDILAREWRVLGDMTQITGVQP